jgi:RHH-type proline utilization regulon transcriptional repressor/proline dehydrogenase/delta 1-pyrroline-5-carboxylate dehydrogenase
VSKAEAIGGWNHGNKLEVDANYKRMAVYGMRPENAQAVQLGIASHTLFELAYAFQIGAP